MDTSKWSYVIKSNRILAFEHVPPQISSSPPFSLVITSLHPSLNSLQEEDIDFLSLLPNDRLSSCYGNWEAQQHSSGCIQ